MKPQKLITYTLIAFSVVLVSLVILIKPTGHYRLPVAGNPGDSIAQLSTSAEAEPPFIQFHELPSLRLRFGVKSLAVLPDHELLIAGDDGVFRTRSEGRYTYTDRIIDTNSYGITVTDSLVLVLSNRFPLLHKKAKQRGLGIRDHRFQLLKSTDGGRTFSRMMHRQSDGRLIQYAFDAEQQQLITASRTRLSFWALAGEKPVLMGEERYSRGKHLLDLALHDEQLTYTTNSYSLVTRNIFRSMREDTGSFRSKFKTPILTMQTGGPQGEVTYFTLFDRNHLDEDGRPLPGGQLYRREGRKLTAVTPHRIDGTRYEHLKLVDVRKDGSALCYSAEHNQLLLIRRTGSKVLVNFPMQAGALNAMAYDRERERLYVGFEGSGRNVYYIFRKPNMLPEPDGYLRQTGGKVFYGQLTAEQWDDHSAANPAPVAKVVPQTPPVL